MRERWNSRIEPRNINLVPGRVTVGENCFRLKKMGACLFIFLYTLKASKWTAQLRMPRFPMLMATTTRALWGLALSLPLASAGFLANGQSNIAVYWGMPPFQENLCSGSTANRRLQAKTPPTELAPSNVSHPTALVPPTSPDPSPSQPP